VANPERTRQSAGQHLTFLLTCQRWWIPLFDVAADHSLNNSPADRRQQIEDFIQAALGTLHVPTKGDLVTRYALDLGSRKGRLERVIINPETNTYQIAGRSLDIRNNLAKGQSSNHKALNSDGLTTTVAELKKIQGVTPEIWPPHGLLATATAAVRYAPEDEVALIRKALAPYPLYVLDGWMEALLGAQGILNAFEVYKDTAKLEEGSVFDCGGGSGQHVDIRIADGKAHIENPGSQYCGEWFLRAIAGDDNPEQATEIAFKLLSANWNPPTGKTLYSASSNFWFPIRAAMSSLGQKISKESGIVTIDWSDDITDAVLRQRNILIGPDDEKREKKISDAFGAAVVLAVCRLVQPAKIVLCPNESSIRHGLMRLLGYRSAGQPYTGTSSVPTLSAA
jgi:hypothetical protein